MIEKEQNSVNLTMLVKDLEQQNEIFIKDKEENEKVIFKRKFFINSSIQLCY